VEPFVPDPGAPPEGPRVEPCGLLLSDVIILRGGGVAVRSTRGAGAESLGNVLIFKEQLGYL